MPIDVIELPKLKRKHPSLDMREWSHSAPFVINSMAMLVHRVKHAGDFHDRQGEKTHSWVQYLCGNGTAGQTGERITFVADPGDRLICQRCEQIAANQRLPSADEICGRHVHVGVLRPRRVCCNKNRESN